MSALDLSNHELRDLLRWACNLTVEQREAWLRFFGHMSPGGTAAMKVLTTPALAAEVVRALLERCGVSALDRPGGKAPGKVRLWHMVGGDGLFVLIVGERYVLGPPGRPVPMAKVPSIILALLDATDAEGAMRALEVGR